MNSFWHGYVVTGLAGLVGALLAVGTLTIGRTIRLGSQHGDQTQKSTAYESGAEPAQGNWTQPSVRFYLLALLFLIFDVEVVFIVPWAVQVEAFGAFGLVELAMFVGILALGLAYAWRKGVLRWH